jgi:hypothetical protein
MMAIGALVAAIDSTLKTQVKPTAVSITTALIEPKKATSIFFWLSINAVAIPAIVTK